MSQKSLASVDEQSAKEHDVVLCSEGVHDTKEKEKFEDVDADSFVVQDAVSSAQHNVGNMQLERESDNTPDENGTKKPRPLTDTTSLNAGEIVSQIQVRNMSKTIYHVQKTSKIETSNIAFV
jgi:hypothetical protein